MPREGLHVRVSQAHKGLLQAELNPWLPGLVRGYYFLSSNCCFQVIISLQRENNIGSYVISTSMNLEVITKWVDFFSLLKEEKNKFEIVCIWLRIFMNYSPCFLITYFTHCICVWYRINLYGKD